LHRPQRYGEAVDRHWRYQDDGRASPTILRRCLGLRHGSVFRRSRDQANSARSRVPWAFLLAVRDMAMCVIRKRCSLRLRQAGMAFRGHRPNSTPRSAPRPLFHAIRDMMVNYALVNAMAMDMIARIGAFMMVTRTVRRSAIVMLPMRARRCAA